MCVVYSSLYLLSRDEQVTRTTELYSIHDETIEDNLSYFAFSLFCIYSKFSIGSKTAVYTCGYRLKETDRRAFQSLFFVSFYIHALWFVSICIRSVCDRATVGLFVRFLNEITGHRMFSYLILMVYSWAGSHKICIWSGSEKKTLFTQS